MITLTNSSIVTLHRDTLRVLGSTLPRPCDPALGAEDRAVLTLVGPALERPPTVAPVPTAATREVHDHLAVRLTDSALEGAVELLRAAPYTRRAVVNLWTPADSALGAGGAGAPCAMYLWFRRTTPFTFELTVHMRACDAWAKLPADLAEFSGVVRRVAGRVWLRPARLVLMIDTLHIYTHHWPAVARWLRETAPTPLPDADDPGETEIDGAGGNV